MINTLSNFLTLNGCYGYPSGNTKKVLSPFEESLDKLMEKVASNFKSKDELVIVHPKKDDIVAEFVNGKEDLVNHLKENNFNLSENVNVSVLNKLTETNPSFELVFKQKDNELILNFEDFECLNSNQSTNVESTNDTNVESTNVETN